MNINTIKKEIIENTLKSKYNYGFYAFIVSPNELIITQLKMAFTSLIKSTTLENNFDESIHYNLEYNYENDNFIIRGVSETNSIYQKTVLNMFDDFFKNDNSKIKIHCLYKNPISYYLGALIEDCVVYQNYSGIKKNILKFFYSDTFPFTSHYSMGYYHLLLELKKMSNKINFVDIEKNDLSKIGINNHFNKTKNNIKEMSKNIFFEIINNKKNINKANQISHILFEDINCYNNLDN